MIGAAKRGRQVEVSVIVPTYNEAGNLPVLLDRLHTVLDGMAYEIVVVDDDSPDQTWRIAQDRSTTDPSIRVIRRMGCRGLSSAVLEGMDAASGAIMAVLDADLQHDEAILPELIEAIRSGRADVAIGSREAPGGSYGEFGPVRRFLSFVGAKVASAALGVGVSDPMSGYFALSAERYAAVRSSVNPRGFKILLDMLATGQRPEVVEVGYGFRSRRSGETKLTGGVVASFGISVAELAFRRVTTRASRAATAGGSAITDPTGARPGAFGPYVCVVVMATGARVTAASMLAAAGFGSVATLLAVELGVLAEFVGHEKLSFRASAGDRRRDPALRRLGVFHVVAAASVLAQAAVGTGVARLLLRPTTGFGQVPAYALAVGGVMAIVAAGFRVNQALVWPRSLTSPDGRVGDRAGDQADDQADDQESRPMTPSTSEEISSTARR